MKYRLWVDGRLVYDSDYPPRSDKHLVDLARAFGLPDFCWAMFAELLCDSCA